MKKFALILFFVLFDLTFAQYKAPLYMGFLMPKKYTRNLTNMQSKANCGSVCPQQQQMNNQQNFNNQDDSFMSTPHQFNSYQSSSQSGQNQNEFKFPATNFQWEKNVQQFNNFQTNKNEPQVTATKFICCGNQNTNKFSSMQQQPSQNFANAYTNAFNWQNNLYNKAQWESPSFDQWIRQQPQDGPFVLYTGSQVQQRQPIQQYSRKNDWNTQEQFAYPTARVVNMNNQMGFD